MIDLADLHAANIARQAEWCPDQLPDLSFRGNELAGETGEACNVIKKLERERHGWRGSRATVEQLAEELADVVICADLCAVTAGIDLDAAVRDKFNATSEKVGLTTKLAVLAAPTAKGGTKATIAEWLSSQEREAREMGRVTTGGDAEWYIAQAFAFEAAHAYVVSRKDEAVAPPAGGSGDLGALSAGATLGPWYVESEPTDGTYGSGEDCSEGYDAFTILTEAEKHYGAPGALFNTHNSTVGCVETESNEDTFSAWDAVAKANAEFVCALVNAYRSGRLIEAPTPDLGAQGEPVAWAQMLDALKSVNKLIAEAGMTGFNCHDGDWAERLFFSQQATSAAIKAASAAPAAPRSGSGVTVEGIAAIVLKEAWGDGNRDAVVERAGRYPEGAAATTIARCRKVARAILALLQAPRPGETGDGWQPIETAPKEQQPIMLALDRGRYGDISRAPVIAFWSDIQNDWRMWNASGSIGAVPTHWRHLPAPPAPSQPHAAQSEGDER